jgi:hypothetical protein
MRLPPMTTPEGLFQYVLALIISAAVFFLVLLWAGLWTV